MVKSATPWAELRELAKRQFKGHYKANPREVRVRALSLTLSLSHSHTLSLSHSPLTLACRTAAQMPEVQPEYIELAKSRLYEGDGRTVQASFDDTIHHFPTGTDSNLRRAPDHVYGFLEAVGAKLIPHGSQGEPVYDSVIRGELARGEGELDHGSFFDHLVGNEQCLREWQLIDGEDKFDDAVCLAGLFHSVYGTQGYQAAQFPVEKRAELVALIGERAENLAYWTCAMERPTWREMVLENKGLRRGETPVGSFSGRRSSLGKPVDTVWTGEEDWCVRANSTLPLALG
jgi:hypothetical protein